MSSREESREVGRERRLLHVEVPNEAPSHPGTMFRPLSVTAGVVSTTPAVTDALGCKRDQKARVKIYLMVKPHCLVHVHQSKNAKEAWDALEKAFEDKGLNNSCKLLTKLVSLKLEQFTSVRKYVTASMNIVQVLRDIRKEIDDELLAALLLQGLTEEFQPMRLAIENISTPLPHPSG